MVEVDAQKQVNATQHKAARRGCQCLNAADAHMQVVKVDGAATDQELLAALQQLGKRAEVVTHTRGMSQPPPPSSPSYLKMQLFMRLLGRKVNCCS
jgi:hypothetical protein